MGTIKEMDVQRRLVAYKTAQAWNQIPHVAFSYEPDITGFYEEFRTLRPGVEGLSLNTLLIKAVAEGLKAAPALNSALAFDPATSSGSLETFGEINVDIPWLLPDGRMMALTAFGLERKSPACS